MSIMIFTLASMLMWYSLASRLGIATRQQGYLHTCDCIHADAWGYIGYSTWHHCDHLWLCISVSYIIVFPDHPTIPSGLCCSPTMTREDLWTPVWPLPVTTPLSLSTSLWGHAEAPSLARNPTPWPRNGHPPKEAGVDPRLPGEEAQLWSLPVRMERSLGVKLSSPLQLILKRLHFCKSLKRLTG